MKIEVLRLESTKNSSFEEYCSASTKILDV